MKSITLRYLAPVLLAFAFLAGPSQSKGCDLSFSNLDSVVTSGPNYIAYMTLCIGGGITAGLKGANAHTTHILFGFHTPGAVPLTILGFNPPTITGDSSGCTNTGANVGPQVGLNNNQGTIAYLFNFACTPCSGIGDGIFCICNTASCGNRHNQCIQFNFTVDTYLDSIRIFSVEGTGFPTAGCYPNSDMLITFPPLPVTWAGFDGVNRKEGIELNWSTVMETNNDFFRVERSDNGSDWDVLATVPGQGNASTLSSYRFLDRNPHIGANHYRIVQVDFDGQSDKTDVIVLTFDAPAGLKWTSMGQNPVADYTQLAFSSESDANMTLQVFDITGKLVVNRPVAARTGGNTIDLDVTQFEAGMYFLRVGGADGMLEHKFLVQ